MLEKAYRIRGNVQGVGFRWWTRSQAQQLGVCGSVRNCPDGTVEVQVHGSHDSVERFERLLRSGPTGARVEAIEPLQPRSVPSDGFHILR